MPVQAGAAGGDLVAEEPAVAPYPEDAWGCLHHAPDPGVTEVVGAVVAGLEAGERPGGAVPPVQQAGVDPDRARGVLEECVHAEPGLPGGPLSGRRAGATEQPEPVRLWIVRIEPVTVGPDPEHVGA